MNEIGPITKIITDTNILISTDSARILVDQFREPIWKFVLPFLTSAAAAFAAIMSYFSTRKTTKLSHLLFLNELNREYSDLSARLFDEYNPNSESGILIKNKKSMCNFFQKICSYYYHGSISRDELLTYSIDLFNEPFVKYADNENKKNKNLGSYIHWLCENDIIKR